MQKLLFYQIQIEMIKRLGLGGAHFYSVFDDDIDNELGCGVSPCSIKDCQ